MDQAASLRRWATEREAISAPPASVEVMKTHNLMVLGLSGPCQEQAGRVIQRLTGWSNAGHRWVGDVRRWSALPVSARDPNLETLVQQESRWALWIDSDLNAFERAYLTLRQSIGNGGPKRLLALHVATMSKKGLLTNLQNIAAGNFGVELLVLAR